MNLLVFVALILPLMMGTTEANSSASLGRDKRMEDRQFSFTFGSNRPSGGSYRPNGENNGGQIVSSFLSLINNFGGNNRPNNGNNGGHNHNGQTIGNSNRPCSRRNQCGKGQGDCETDQDCTRGLFCGKNNCKGEFGSGSHQGTPWDKKDDCCTDNRYYCNQADLFPNWRRTCCSPSNPCPFRHGDCDKDSDCVSNLVCGDNNCKDFHSYAGNKDDCCTYPEKKKRSLEGNETFNMLEDIVMKPFKQMQDETKREKRAGQYSYGSSNGGYSSSNGGFGSSNGGHSSSNGGFGSSNGGFGSSNGGVGSSNGGYGSSNGGFGSSNGGHSSSNGGFGSSNGGFGSSNGGYGSSNGGFGSSNGGFGSSNGGFGSSNGGFSSSNGNSRPNGGGGRPNGGGGRPNGGGGRPNGGGGRPHGGVSRPTGNSNLSGCEGNPNFRCCTKERPCALGGGDCNKDNHCQGSLVCGSNNCRKFHPNADRKMDCCAYKKIK